MHGALNFFHPLVAQWFRGRFGTPTEPQIFGWSAIQAGKDTLIAAPTGSGKTLAAFLSCLDGLVRAGLEGSLRDETTVLYVSPLKALNNDIQKNLRTPLGELVKTAIAKGLSLPEIRTAVRTGDTPSGERSAMIKKPPHILITTPESLYLLLTSESGRRILATVRTVIIDEIHAVARDKRGAHLAISLERLDRLATLRPNRPLRIGLSATQKPIDEIARFLVGTKAAARSDCAIIDAGHKRRMDLRIEIPKEEFSAVASKELWEDTYNRIAELILEHKSTLVFVNTRRLVERTTHALEKRLGENVVGAHHGSLSKEIRLKAEENLKAGKSRAVVATASLELGIDVGDIDLVCHIGSPRNLSVGLQRIGRAGHAPSGDAKPLVVPKGRIFPVTRDELIECAAFVRGVHRGHLEKTKIPDYPLDILAQQIVAIVASEEKDVPQDALFDVIRGAWPYARLPREDFDAVVTMLAEGISTARGSKGAWLHRDGMTGVLRPRRGARLAALTSGGAIPDNFTYAVVKEPEGLTVGTLEEDFAVESLAGDIFLLGNSSWRIKRVEAGRVRVEDAHGQPPTIPFWLGEAPGRSAELSLEVSDLREGLEPLLDPSRFAEAQAFLETECGMPPAGALQALNYLSQAKQGLGCLPTQKTLVAERFFDEGGGMQLVVHAPFGGRLNRAFGLALRKRFCAGFNFELQAAATDDGILLSLGPQHSFPLESVFGFLSSKTVQECLEQAVLDSPIFGVRWRWNATRSLALLRQMGGKRLPPIIQRMRSDDLLAAAFPDQAACQENVERPIKIPDHPLVNETLRDCLHEAMDLEGLTGLLKKIESGEITLVAKDTPTPSPLSHEILNSNPYTYLDDAPLEERRARAVVTRRTLSPEDLSAFGSLDEASIRSVEEEIWPDVRNADELADTLREWILVPEKAVPESWRGWLRDLIAQGRALRLEAADSPIVSAEKKETAFKAWKGEEDAVASVLQGWLPVSGPASVEGWAVRTGLPAAAVSLALVQLESVGVVLRGRFNRSAIESGTEEFCHRDVLARIHRRCLARLRNEIAPVTTAQFVQYLCVWQHVAPGTQLHGTAGLAEVIGQLQGLQLPAADWEEEIFPARVADYDPSLLDEICLNGTVAWGRLSPTLTESDTESGDEILDVPLSKIRRRAAPNGNTPLSLLLRQDLPWILETTGSREPLEEKLMEELGPAARDLYEILRKQGAMFFNELQGVTGRLRTDLDQALWELVAAGLITSDGFSGLRNLLNPARRREKDRLLSLYSRSHRPFLAGPGGRWSLFRGVRQSVPEEGTLGETKAIENLAIQYLHRWGVVFRDMVIRESAGIPWRVLLNIYRRLEARGEIRGGRFAEAFAGEQFALPEAVETLRAVRRQEEKGIQTKITISATDPLNVTGILTPPPRIPATRSRQVTWTNGVPAKTSPSLLSMRPRTLPTLRGYNLPRGR